MSSDSDLPVDPPQGGDGASKSQVPTGGKLVELAIEDELKGSYLTYAMSVIVSRALPDVRDGLKPSQRRILVAMNDLNLTPGASRVKCAKISGDTSGNYHPHGESVIYPTLVRMAQEWNVRYVLVDKQGNFGSIAGLPPAAMRYTEARLSPFSALMLEDLKLDTVDYSSTYDERRTEPTVLPSLFPNLLVNGANGIAVGMATSVPPHNLGEICDSLIKVIDEPEVSIDELLEICPGPDFPTGGVVCGRSGIRRGYHTGRSTIVVRARAQIEEMPHGRSRIVVSEIPYQQARDRVEERIAELVNEGRIEGISGIRNESDLNDPVRLVLDLKRDADPEVVLNQLYQFSSLQDSFSIILLALVDGKPRVLSFKGMLEEYLRHRVTVIRRRTQHLLAKARQRKHTVEGLLLAHVNIDEVIRVIRTSSTQAEAKQRLMQIECPAAMLERRFGSRGVRHPGRGTRAHGELHAHSRPVGRDPPHDPGPVGQSRTRAPRRRTQEPSGRHRRVQPHSFPRGEHPRHGQRRPPRAEAEIRRRPPHGDQRRGSRRARHGRAHRRRDHGRLHFLERLHQAHPDQRLPRASTAAARGS